MDYSKYHFSTKELAIVLLEGTALLFTVAWLFYQSVFALFLAVPFYPVWIRKKRDEQIRKRKMRLSFEFKEMLLGAAGALNVGYSMERALRETEKDMVKLLGKDSYMVKELAQINSQTALNVPVEKLFGEFAARSGLEDVENFCQVFQFAKRSGGDLTKIIRHTAMRIADKAEIAQEIESVMAAKKLEQKIMSGMPLFILFYIGVSSPDFLAPLYGSAFGVLVMTACLVVYILSIKLAERIVDIQV